MKKIVIKLNDPKFCQGCPLSFSDHIWSSHILKINDFVVTENTCRLGFVRHLIVQSPKDQTKVNMILRDIECIKKKWTLQIQ